MEGEVYLTETDLLRVADFVGLPAADFERLHVYRERHLLRLKKPPDRQCYFHKDNRCSIHAVKPTQCRVFPYWPELTESREAWDEAARTCPGMNQGPLIQIEMAQELGKEMRQAYPTMYTK